MTASPDGVAKYLSENAASCNRVSKPDRKTDAQASVFMAVIWHSRFATVSSNPCSATLVQKPLLSRTVVAGRLPINGRHKSAPFGALLSWVAGLLVKDTEVILGEVDSLLHVHLHLAQLLDGLEVGHQTAYRWRSGWQGLDGR